MKNGRRREPKDSEIPVGEWLEQIGAASIEYVGDDAGGGPPDYKIEYGGERIAVEVRLLDDGIGWRTEKKRAFERAGDVHRRGHGREERCEVARVD